MTRIIPKCLCCDGELVELIDFGAMPLANTYSVVEEFPLVVNRCRECCHLQLNESINPSILFSDYVYCSGTSETALEFFDDFAQMVMESSPKATSALDIASNDGSQLDAFKRRGLTTAGVDPAENLCEIAARKGHVVYVGLFEHIKFQDYVKFDIITAQNVLAHTPDPMAFLLNCKKLMHEGTRLFVTASQADMISHGQCDTIYHEHISYFNLRSIRELALRAGIALIDVQMNPIHGTSYVFVFALNGTPSSRVIVRGMHELNTGLQCASTYDKWKGLVWSRIESIRLRITELREQGYFLIGCGAAAKGITILNMAGVRLDILVDTTPAKQDRIASGMKILPFDAIGYVAAERVAFVVLAWNFEDEVVRNVRKYRDRAEDVFLTTR